MFLNISFFVFLLFIILVILTGFYIWRRISNMELYIKVLEKKINTLKKDNRELRDLLYGDDIINEEFNNDSNQLMNKIFNPDIVFTSEHSNSDIEKNVCDDEKCNIEHNKISDDLNEPINILNELPIVNHNDNDIESVISDFINCSNGVYNKKKLLKFNVDKLKEICITMNLSIDGTKNLLIDRILSNITIE